MWKIGECLMSGYDKVPDFGSLVWIVSALVGVVALIWTIIGFVALKIKPWSFYMVFVLILGLILLVCIDIDNMIIVIGCGLQLLLLIDLVLVLETGVRRLGRDAAWVAAGLTLFTIALFFFLAPIGKTVYSMLTTSCGGPVTQRTEATR
jgi:hypothetical protein